MPASIGDKGSFLLRICGLPTAVMKKFPMESKLREEGLMLASGLRAHHVEEGPVADTQEDAYSVWAHQAFSLFNLGETSRL